MRAGDVVREHCGTRYTGAVLRVEHRGRVVHESAHGAVDDGAGAAPVCNDTRFDVASLTKPLLAYVALRAVARRMLALDEPLVRWLSEWRGTPQAGITLRALLAHVAGLHSGADYRTLFGAAVERFALTNPPAAPPFERVIYSDLGFIALGVLLERIWNRGLAAIVEPEAAAIGARTARYRPAESERGAIPATECDAWRGRVRGTVHDEKCHLMNGVAGHAGIFGSAADAGALGEAFLGPLHGRAGGGLPAGLARAAVTEQAFDPVLRRGLGWALKTRDDNSCGVLASAQTFGHTGFVGTCLWVDPERDASVTFLTNAVYFGRSDLRDVRAAVCDAAFAGIDACARSA